MNYQGPHRSPTQPRRRTPVSPWVRCDTKVIGNFGILVVIGDLLYLSLTSSGTPQNTRSVCLVKSNIRLKPFLNQCMVWRSLRPFLPNHYKGLFSLTKKTWYTCSCSCNHPKTSILQSTFSESSLQTENLWLKILCLGMRVQKILVLTIIPSRPDLLFKQQPSEMLRT